MAKAPAFQFYPKDWLADAKVKRLDYFAKGVYIELLAMMWNEGNDSIADDSDLPMLLHLTPEKWAQVRAQFQKDSQSVFIEKDGTLVSRRLQAERRKQRKLKKKRQSAARARWGCKSNASALQMECLASASAIASADNTPYSPPFRKGGR